MCIYIFLYIYIYINIYTHIIYTKDQSPRLKYRHHLVISPMEIMATDCWFHPTLGAVPVK